MDLASCDNCGIVVDRFTYAMETRAVYNDDQVGEAVQCPLCKNWINPDVWQKRTDDEPKP